MTPPSISHAQPGEDRDQEDEDPGFATAFHRLGNDQSFEEAQGLVHSRQPREQLVAGIGELLVRLGDGRRRVGIELELLVLGGQKGQPIPDRVSQAALSSIGLLFSAFCLAAFFWLESCVRRLRTWRLRTRSWPASRAASNMVAILRLAAANSALALASPSIAAGDDCAPLLLVLGDGLAVQSFELFGEPAASLGVFAVGLLISRGTGSVDLGLDLGALGHEVEDLPQDRCARG